MTQSTLIKILSQLETLEPKELQELDRAIQVRSQAPDESFKIEKPYDSLLSSG